VDVDLTWQRSAYRRAVIIVNAEEVGAL